MTSSWDSYYIVFLSAVLSLGIPATLAVISFVFFQRGKGKNKSKNSGNNSFPLTKPNRTVIGQRINVRFFLAANAALILITLALALVPCATTLQLENREGLVKGLFALVTISGFAVLGLLYSVRKGDMGWLSSFQTDNYKEKRNE